MANITKKSFVEPEIPFVKTTTEALTHIKIYQGNEIKTTQFLTSRKVVKLRFLLLDNGR